MDPAAVGNAFVSQYFEILHQSPELVHRFYQEKSQLSRPDSNGDLVTVTTAQAINEMILAAVDYSEFKAEIETVDTQESYNDGVIVLVTGNITAKDFIKKDFSQVFFLAPQDKGFYVSNDIFRYTAKNDYVVTSNGIASGVQVEIVSSRSCRNQPQKAPPKSTINSRESYVAGKKASKTEKMKETPKEPTFEQGKKASKTEKMKETPKEPTFSCPICMCEIVSPFSTTCGHIFCEQCIKTAIEVRKICPTCRTKLSCKNSIHKVILPAVFDRSPN